jgi:hypothetical protein
MMDELPYFGALRFGLFVRQTAHLPVSQPELGAK